jgi:5-methyltetrahydropteroyltriglutamate--homocysteine methyltransferase
MATSHILGYPRIGPRRELKFALEAFWQGAADQNHLHSVGASIRETAQRHQALRLDCVTAGDFAFYDLMLEHARMFGCAPQRFNDVEDEGDLIHGFAMARGTAGEPALEMTKWFDTNYHYLVPELDSQTLPAGHFVTYLGWLREAKLRAKPVKAVVIGPVTFLKLSKSRDPQFDRLRLLPALLECYADLMRQIKALGIEWVQIDEPILCLDLEPQWLDAFDLAYASLSKAGAKLLLTTYFDTTEPYIERIRMLPVQGIHLDLVRAPEQLDAWLSELPEGWILSAGIVDGRNVWRCDLRHAVKTLQSAHQLLGERLWVAPSCSLLHVPVSTAAEHNLDGDVACWLAFADEKIEELQAIARALSEGEEMLEPELAASDRIQKSRRSSGRVSNALVQKRLAEVTEEMQRRSSPFDRRNEKQRAIFKLPAFPTTTIGSFPQTNEIRKLRARYKRQDIGSLEYLEGMRAQIRLAVAKQESYGLDVLVHGEAERNDMVEYFGEQLWGYAFTANGWVQSYGSRCVKPPIIYGDVYRPEAMTVEWTRYAQSLTPRVMKGMLTGPVTMLQWSFVRDDQPRSTTALQIALALRAEVGDLEKAGIGMIQIDEPALREGLPLKQADWPRYLKWATAAFRIAASGVRDETQIHTHMCYSEFNDILPSIAALDADVITIETSRSDMELLDGFGNFAYPNQIGPGVYDIHSPRVPSIDDMVRLLYKAAKVIPAERLWVNPDCGLKTRIWDEVDAALTNMVAAAQLVRERYVQSVE